MHAAQLGDAIARANALIASDAFAGFVNIIIELFIVSSEQLFIVKSWLKCRFYFLKQILFAVAGSPYTKDIARSIAQAGLRPQKLEYWKSDVTKHQILWTTTVGIERNDRRRYQWLPVPRVDRCWNKAANFLPKDSFIIVGSIIEPLIVYLTMKASLPPAY